MHERSAQIDPRHFDRDGVPHRTACLRKRAFWTVTTFGDGRCALRSPLPRRITIIMIDVETGNVIEFVDPELEQLLQRQIAERLGFRLVDHRMELYGVSLSRKD